MVELHRIGFPLDVQHIQNGASGLDKRQLESLQLLTRQGVQTIAKHRDIVILLSTEVFPTLRRSMQVRLLMNKHIFVKHGASGNMKHFNLHDQNDYLVARFEDLSDEGRANLITWLEKLLRQVRLHEVVVECVKMAMTEKLSPTAAHLKHLWPTLTTVIEPSVARHNHSERERLATWIERFRNPPMRGLSRYDMAPEIAAKYSKLMAVADVQIAAGRMIAEPKLDQTGAIYPVVYDWERLPGDIVFPLRG
jgi:hypothetical protein